MQHAAIGCAQQFGNLKGCVWAETKALIRMQLARGLETGRLGINRLLLSMPEAPLGDVKESGRGAECGMEGVQAYGDVQRISEAAKPASIKKKKLFALACIDFSIENAWKRCMDKR